MERIPANTAILENMWAQYSALGVLFFILISAVIILYRINRNKEGAHKKEWEKLRVEQREDRELYDKRHDKKAEMFIKAINENALKFATVIEGSLKENNQFLIENKIALNNCRKT